MKAQLFSIIAGSEACNARCPFCISKMTPLWGIELKEPEVNWRNFRIAANYAKQAGAITAMLTSKGEPTLFPEQITKYLKALKEHDFPLLELQTNGILLYEQQQKYDTFLNEWYGLGLTTVAVSISHYDPEANRQIYLPHKDKYINLPGLVDNLHAKGYSVRLACVMADGFIHSPEGLEKLIAFARENEVEQLTVRPVNKPQNPRNGNIETWVDSHFLKDKQLRDITAYLSEKGHQLMKLPHGATVYDVNGQNVCMANSLTIEKEGEDVRQLIFFPDGHLRFDWQYKGAVLL
ncbi:MAG: radical SAM protein [Candidatus Woesearchaeota archaeon]